MKAVITLTHSDSVSGTTIFDDGTKAFWSEGREAYTVFLRPNGDWEEAGVSDQIHKALGGKLHPILELMLDDDRHLQAYGKEEREMTPVEELEHTLARNRGNVPWHEWRKK